LQPAGTSKGCYPLIGIANNERMLNTHDGLTGDLMPLGVGGGRERRQGKALIMLMQFIHPIDGASIAWGMSHIEFR